MSTTAGLKSSPFNHQKPVPFWCSFIQGVSVKKIALIIADT
jgi:hypothetical protein